MILYLLDANRFKQINDKYGHAEGEETALSACRIYRLYVSG